MFLPPSNEEAQLTSLPDQIFFLIRRQALPFCRRALKLSVSLGGTFAVICTPAIAQSGSTASDDAANAGCVYDQSADLAASSAEPPGLDFQQSGVSAHPRPTQRFTTKLCLLEGKRSPYEALAPETLLIELVPSGTQSDEVAFDGATETASRAVAVDGIVIDGIVTEAIPMSPKDIDAVDDGITEEEWIAQAPETSSAESSADSSDFLSDELESLQENSQDGQPDDELGILRLRQERSRSDDELGILRLLQTASVPPPPPREPIAFLSGRLGFFSSENAFRSNPKLSETIYQSGLSLYLFPELSNDTSLYAIAETNLARYENFESVDYNELEVQIGLRQRLLPRTHAQIGWRNQRLYSPGYRDKLFSVNYIDTLISHRSILNSRTWLDSFYQARLGFANPDAASRFRQTFTLSLNYGVSRDLRTSLLYQLDFDDYTQIPRYDSYQQVLGIVSYNVTPESRVSLFGGTRFGRSSSPGVNLNDTFYGAGLNVSVPLF
ncbi:MAG: hypothetical protein WBD47_06230 [Phormidesmis sp.]